MGLTAIMLTYSPWGKQSGAHYNPSVTLTFLRLGKVAMGDAVFYVIAQFVGGTVGVLVAALAFRTVVAHPSVHYVVTAPGMPGAGVAFLAELAIAFLLMSVILRVSNTPKLARCTGLFAGALVAAYITVEAPLSGMSMNPARTFGSAFAARDWTALWVYFTAPLMGMFLAAEVYVRRRGAGAVGCAKLHHQNHSRCIFCDYRRAQTCGRTQARVSDYAPASRKIAAESGNPRRDVRIIDSEVRTHRSTPVRQILSPGRVDDPHRRHAGRNRSAPEGICHSPQGCPDSSHRNDLKGGYQ
jgi:aquaporin Z